MCEGIAQVVVVRGRWFVWSEGGDSTCIPTSPGADVPASVSSAESGDTGREAAASTAGDRTRVQIDTVRRTCRHLPLAEGL